MIYVVTAVHDRKAITEAFIMELKRQTYPDIHLVLVDDGSTDGTGEMVRSLCPQGTILQGDGNLWWGGALHQAYLYIKSQDPDPEAFVMFTNDDCFYSDDYIERAVERLSSMEKTLLTGYGVSRQTGEQMEGAVVYDFAEARSKTRRGEDHAEGNCASTRSLFFRVKDLLTIGGFHPVLLPHYTSDYEWTIRACRKYGYRVVCDRDIAYEINEASTGDNFYDKLNRAKVFSKRSVTNPFYKLSFIFLTTPWRLLPKALGAQFRRYSANKDVIKDIMKK